MEFSIKQEDIKTSRSLFEYIYNSKLTIPKKLFEILKYSTKPFAKEGIVYITKDYVAYADLYIKRSPAQKIYEVKIDNIRRKEYFNEPLSQSDKRDLDKITKGIEYTAEKIKYIKSCGGEIKKGSLTGKFF